MEHEGPEPDVSRETPPTEETWSALERWLGLSLSPTQRDHLIRYRIWLEEEALGAGGIGPGEVQRLYDRHVFDSLAYLRGVGPSKAAAGLHVADIGSGVGLPGIPLAIACPTWQVTLVDRSDRRTHLSRRAVRVLGLSNVEVLTADVHRLEGSFDLVVFRASLPIPQAYQAFTGIAGPDGIGLLGVSRRRESPGVPTPPEGVAYELSSEGSEVLDSPFWLLRMRHTQAPRAE